MSERFDVVIAGARCAGSPLAAHLARRGLRVLLVDAADDLSVDTPSTHVFQTDGVNALARLGVLDEVLATGAPPIVNFYLQLEDVVVDAPVQLRPGDLGIAGLCVRRGVLDSIVAGAAVAAGAELRTGTRVVDVRCHDGRVAGVELDGPDGRYEVDADLVVGADGRLSTVAKAVGARKYHRTPSPRVFHWRYFEGVEVETPVRATILRAGYDAVLAAPCDNGAYLVALGFDKAVTDTKPGPEFDAVWWDSLAQFPLIADKLAGTRMVGELRVSRYDGFFRESAGPGWVLVGDAGQFKDPSPGQGITDAFRQVEQLVPAIVEGLAGGPAELDRRMAAWWAWRDDDAFDMHWFASDVGEGGMLSPVVKQVIRSIVRTPQGTSDFLDVFGHRLAVSQLINPKRAVGAAVRLLLKPPEGHTRGEVLREVRRLAARDRERAKWRKRPVYFGEPEREPEPSAV